MDLQNQRDQFAVHQLKFQGDKTFLKRNQRSRLNLLIRHPTSVYDPQSKTSLSTSEHQVVLYFSTIQQKKGRKIDGFTATLKHAPKQYRVF